MCSLHTPRDVQLNVCTHEPFAHTTPSPPRRDGDGDAVPHRRRGPPPRTTPVSCQTGADLMKGVGDPEVLEAAAQLAVLREALAEIGVVGSPNDDGGSTSNVTRPWKNRPELC